MAGPRQELNLQCVREIAACVYRFATGACCSIRIREFDGLPSCDRHGGDNHG